MMVVAERIMLAMIVALMAVATCLWFDNERTKIQYKKAYYDAKEYEAMYTLCRRDLTTVADEYEDLADHYHELCVAYTRAYAILEEHDLLPKEEE